MPKVNIKKILIVEDDYFISLVTKKYLNKLGFEVSIETNGKLAIHYLKTTNKLPDLILTDIRMPIMNGLDFLKNIKKEEKYKKIPVFAITSEAKEIMMENQIDGFEKIISKPFSLVDLSNYIKNRLNTA